MAMKWRKSPETLVRTFDAMVPDDPRIERRKMFGYPAAFLAGNLFMSLFQESLVLRLPDGDRTAFLRLDGAAAFAPMPGRPMREYVVVPPGMIAQPKRIAPWIRRSLEYARSLPPKTAKRGAAGRGSERPADAGRPAKRGSPTRR